MRRILAYTLIFIIFIVFTACNNAKLQSVKTNPYIGRALRIGIIGEPPEVREEQARFVKIRFSDLEKGMFDSRYDAIFITRGNLSEASQEKYKSAYKKSKIPFFFIQSKKSYIPFTVEGLTYDDVPDMEDLTYATGIIYDNDNNKLKFWGYGLYNDIENQTNVKDVYSRIFETISQNIEARNIIEHGKRS